MPSLITPTFSGDLAINIGGLLKDFTEEDFFEICRQNPKLRVEMSKEGDIIFCRQLEVRHQDKFLN